MNTLTLNKVLLNARPLNMRRRVVKDKDFYYKGLDREFNFSITAGGKRIKSSTATITRLKGNSVVWNQKAQPLMLSNYTLYDHSATEDNGIHINTLVANVSKGILQANSPLPLLSHKWLAYADIRSDAELIIKGMTTTGFIANSTCRIYAFYTATNNNEWYWGINYKDNIPTSVDIYSFRIIDLTQLFQAGNEPTTIEEFYARKPIVEDEYAYNEGEVIHMTAEGIKSVGDNAWDEEWEVGYLTSTGESATGYVQNYIRAKNYIPVISGEKYYAQVPADKSDAQLYACDENYNLVKHISNWRNKTFTIPEGAKYIRFYMNYGGEVYNNDIMITLVHSGWKQDTDAGYQPYWQDTLPLPIIRKYFPDGMKSAGSTHDEIRFNKASGKWEKVQRIDSVDMGSLEWEVISYNGVPTFRSFGVTNAVEHNADKLGNSITALYSQKTKFANLTEDENKVYVLNSEAHTPNTLAIRDNSYTDAASFKAAMAGVPLCYELAEPTIIEYDEPFNLDYKVADFGTEQAIAEQPSAPISAEIGYHILKNNLELTLNS